MLALALLPLGLLLQPPPVVQPPMAPMAHVRYEARTLSPLDRASVAVGEVEQRDYTEEERNAARQKGLAVFLFGALPSVWAQDQLIWSKQRKPEEPKGKKKRR